MEKKKPEKGDVIYYPACIAPSGAVVGDFFGFHDEEKPGDREVLVVASDWNSLESWKSVRDVKKSRVIAQCECRDFVDAQGNWRGWFRWKPADMNSEDK